MPKPSKGTRKRKSERSSERVVSKKSKSGIKTARESEEALCKRGKCSTDEVKKLKGGKRSLKSKSVETQKDSKEAKQKHEKCLANEAKKTGKTLLKSPKRSKCNVHKQKDSKEATNVKPDEFEEEDTSLLEDVDIDEELDRSASKSNLSVFNVKSILHDPTEKHFGDHVLSDDRVIAMACKAAEDDESDTKEEVTLHQVEPKLTRSKFREVAQSTGTADPLMLVKETIIHSPLKTKVSPLKMRSTDEIHLSQRDEHDGPKVPLVDINFSEEAGSSDEEYDPLKEGWGESEEDSESCLSNTSDLASPEPLRRTSRVKKCLLPDIVSSPSQSEPDKNDESTTFDQTEDISSPFKVPYPITKKSEEQKEKENADLIATRTRSRLPLTDTSLESLEANFVAPDFFPDLINLEELDSEDIDWHKWLFGLTTEKAATPDTEDPEDSEYNFMAEDLKEEQEEYRNDRAVKVSQRELVELFEEFLAEFEDEIAESELKNSASLLATTNSEAPTVIEETGITPQQTECLIGQLQQHTQLLAQVYLLAREHPSLQEETMICHAFINEMLQQNDAASTANVCRMLESTVLPPSVFSYVGLAEAARIINLPPVASTPWPPAVSYTNITVKPGPPGTSCDIHSDKEPPIPARLTEIFVSSHVFMYTGLLPHVAFRPDRPKSKAQKFLACEDNLLVLGIAEFDNNWHQIQRNYLPTKTTKQIKIRRKNLWSSRAPDNVVKQFKQTGKVPHLPVYMTFKVSKDRQRILLPVGNKLSTVPAWLKMRHDAQVVKAKLEEREAKAKCGRKKRKVPYDVAVACKKEFPIVYPVREVENVVRIKPKVPIEPVTTPIFTDHVSPAIVVCRENTRTGEIILETLEAQPPQEINSTKSSDPLQDKETLNMSTTVPDEHQVELINENEIHSPEVSSRLLDSPSTRIHELSEKENLQPFKEQCCEETTSTSQSDTHEDAKIRDRAIAFAQSYLSNVKERLKDNSSTYQAFLKVLLTSKSESWSPAKLYNEVSGVLESFPELVRDFVGFLEPHQAFEAGEFMTNNGIFRARAFLERIETHFQKSPSHFQKIIKAFTQFNFKEPKPAELYDTVVPLLKGQQYLTDEFNTFFNHLKPPPSNSEDFEEVELGSGSEIEVDDFEEVTIPDIFHSRNARKSVGKGKFPAKTAVKLPGNRKQSYMSDETRRKEKKIKKRDADLKNSEENFKDVDKTRDCYGDGDMGETSEGGTGALNDIGETSGYNECENYEKKMTDSDEEEPACTTVDEDEDNKDSGMNDCCRAERKYESEPSNDSSPASESANAEDFLDNNIESPCTTQGSQVTSTSEGTSDLSNEACDVPATSDTGLTLVDHCEGSKAKFVDEKTRVKEENAELVIPKDEDENRRPKVTEATVKVEQGGPRINRTGLLKATEDIKIEESVKEREFERISANNLELDKNGKSVVVWTREDDKKILEFYQCKGSSENIYSEIAQELGNKTADQVEGRFQILVELLAASNEAGSSSDDSGSESDEESCDEVDEK